MRVSAAAAAAARRGRTFGLVAAAGCVSLSAALARVAGGQEAGSAPAAALSVDVGSAAENQLRYLQSLGLVPLTQWGLRSFGPQETNLLLGSGGTPRLRPSRGPQRIGVAQVQVAPGTLQAWHNTSYAFGYNDGAVWRGRGLTVAAAGGVTVRAGPLTVAVRPIAWWAQNQPFALVPTGFEDALRFADPESPRGIDRPQRFGEGTVGRLDPGQSTIRLDAGPLAVGVSTANQWWGPAGEWPFVLGNNAPGFPQLFVGSARPLPVGIGRVHGRIIYGVLSQSAYTDIVGRARRRFASGLAVTFLPKGLDGLEVGGTRFFHQPWPEGGISAGNFRKPIEDFFKSNVRGDNGSIDNSSEDNQLASVFARWVFPRAGLELYGEFGREDHNFNERDLILSPDHEATLNLGFRRAWRRGDGGVRGVRFEFFDMDPSVLARDRGQESKYISGGTRQGHTERGQLLGAGFASNNGSASTLAWDSFAGSGETRTLSFSRMVVRQRPAGLSSPPSLDVQYALSGGRTRVLRGREITYGLTGVYQLNRNFGSDRANVLTSLGITW